MCLAVVFNILHRMLKRSLYKNELEPNWPSPDKVLYIAPSDQQFLPGLRVYIVTVWEILRWFEALLIHSVGWDAAIFTVKPLKKYLIKSLGSGPIILYGVPGNEDNLMASEYVLLMPSPVHSCGTGTCG